LSNWISFLRKMHIPNESRKRKTNFSWPLTLIMQKRDHFRLLRHHYSESPVIPLSNDIWYRCVAHGFITFYFLIFYRWSIKLQFQGMQCQHIGDIIHMTVIYGFWLVLWYLQTVLLILCTVDCSDTIKVYVIKKH
jgi:hypothetical protein